MTSPVQAENYYTVGAQRVAAKLTALGIHCPEAILTRPPQKPSEVAGFPEFAGFSALENALLDRFEGRDYEMAQRLIFAPPAEENWHTIILASDDALPSRLSDCNLCTSLEEAIAVVIQQCDRDGVSIDRIARVSGGGGVQLTIAGENAVKIMPVPFEPYSEDYRDRVRSALKHLRHLDSPNQLAARLRKLPGFAKVDMLNGDLHQPNAGCLLLGFPANWAGAMRGALADVGIEVKQHQAQEVTAAFFGAASWHQLTLHDNDARAALYPAVTHWRDNNGLTHRAFYRTTEEAIFALGKRIEDAGGDLVLDHFGLSIRGHALTVSCKERSATDYLDGPFRSGWEDVGGDPPPNERLLAAAGRLAVAAAQPDGAMPDFYGSGDLWQRFVAIQGRAGVPEEYLLAVGDHWLALDLADPSYAGSKDVIRVFRVENRRIITLSTGVTLHKAQMRRRQSESGQGEVVELWENHGRRLVASLPLASARDLENLRSLLLRCSNSMMGGGGPDDLLTQVTAERCRSNLRRTGRD